MPPRIAIATCSAFPQLPDDEPLLVEELRRRGAEAEAAVWDDPAVDWDRYDLVVIRATWDYIARRDVFLAWARSLPRLLNPSDVVAWNTDKRYLADLPHVVATEYTSLPARPSRRPRRSTSSSRSCRPARSRSRATARVRKRGRGCTWTACTAPVRR